MKRAVTFFSLLAFGVATFALSGIHGGFEATVELLPDVELYYAELELVTTYADWEVTSESKFYSDGWRYQNFYLDGSIAGLDVWGKIYFHAQDVRYQKFWLNAEISLPGGKDNYLRLSVDHWASIDNYFSSDVSMFGPWPCAVWWEELLPWDEKEEIYEGETLCVQGPVISYWPPTPTNSLTLNVGAPYNNPRFVVYITGDAFDAMVAKYGPNFWVDLVGETICACGEIVTYGGNPEIAFYDADDIENFHVGECCAEPGVGVGPLMIYRGKIKLDPITLTVDFFDCCEGIAFKKLELELGDMVGCCGFLWNAGLSFTKCHGFEELRIGFEDLFLLCCDVSFEAEVVFTADGKSVSIKPVWEGFVTGCLEVYGDVQWADNILGGFELYGFAIECDFDSVIVRSITAFNPDKVEDLTDVTFYTDEWEYLGIEYTTAGCCDGELTFTSELWFGDEGLLFDLQRVRFELEAPIYEGFTAIVKGQWDFSDPLPLDWFNIGLKIEF